MESATKPPHTRTRGRLRTTVHITCASSRCSKTGLNGHERERFLFKRRRRKRSGAGSACNHSAHRRYKTPVNAIMYSLVNYIHAEKAHLPLPVV